MTYTYKDNQGLHVAIIMDGNGRWATAMGKERCVGHRAGAKSVRKVIKAAPSFGITTLTLYAFSTENWNRPRREVDTLMLLLQHYLENEREKCIRSGVRVVVIGRRDRLSPRLVHAIEETERATRGCDRLLLRIAVDYSARDAIARTVSFLTRNRISASRKSFVRALNAVLHSPRDTPDVDLLIRTSGEQRLSDFLLWECAYAELLFLEKMWPDFSGADLGAAVAEYKNRDRRFGGLMVV
ncbi:MAG: di-trans,poly-cis-decaprenylcistransferase [Deltaproteobacteria bacterium]|nr:di-trans,poly-cis-decaprenylcistransferase [Deltaproteobacteria bacterium]